MKFAVTIIKPKGYDHWPVFLETAETINAGLKSLGHDSKMTDDLTENRRYIVLGANLLPFTEIKTLPEGTILYNLEQYDGWENEWLKDPRYVVWDFDKRNSSRLEQHGIKPATVLPIGYHPILEKVPKVDRPDIDVLFIGSLSPRRQETIQRLLRLGFTVKHLFNCYGTERDVWMARSRVHLNVHFGTNALLETHRLMYAVANRKPVVSEYGRDMEKSVHGVLFDSYHALPEAVEWLLQRPKETRERFTDIAYNNVREEHRIEDYLQNALGVTP